MSERGPETERVRVLYDRVADTYDRVIGPAVRLLLGDGRTTGLRTGPWSGPGDCYRHRPQPGPLPPERGADRGGHQHPDAGARPGALRAARPAGPAAHRGCPGAARRRRGPSTRWCAPWRCARSRTSARQWPRRHECCARPDGSWRWSTSAAATCSCARPSGCWTRCSCVCRGIICWRQPSQVASSLGLRLLLRRRSRLGVVERLVAEKPG